jgi:hypothetical protein
MRFSKTDSGMPAGLREVPLALDSDVLDGVLCSAGLRDVSAAALSLKGVGVTEVGVAAASAASAESVERVIVGSAVRGRGPSAVPFHPLEELPPALATERISLLAVMPALVEARLTGRSESTLGVAAVDRACAESAEVMPPKRRSRNVGIDALERIVSAGDIVRATSSAPSGSGGSGGRTKGAALSDVTAAARAGDGAPCTLRAWLE